MKLRTLLLLSLLAVLGVMTLPAVYALNRVSDIRRIALDLREEAAQSALTVGRIHASLARLDQYQRAYVVTGDPAQRRLARGIIGQIEMLLGRLDTSAYRDVAAGTPFPIDSLATVTDSLGALMAAGRSNDATLTLASDARPLLERAEAAAVALAEALDQATAAQIERADRLTAAAVTATTTALFLALALAAGLAVLLTTLLRRPLARLSGSMAAVASGRFEAPEDLPYGREDEIGDLSRSFRAMALRLADMDRMKAEFVGVASHDVKTPVNVIAGYAELLEEELADSGDPRVRDVVAALAAQARTLGRRVEQLLEISRMEASGLGLGIEEINVRHFTASLEKAHAAEAARHRVAFSTVVAESAPSFLIADPDILRAEVLGNILEHAFRFTPAGGRVLLHVSGEGGQVRFEVRDTGRTIPAEDLPRLFDRYYQGRALGRAGSGLGLPIARAGALAHGGEIEAESGDGETTFRVTLPIRPERRAGEPYPAAAASLRERL